MATILVAEDDPDILHVLRDLLIKHGYTVIGAPDGMKALEICNEQPDRINLVITGIHMPVMNGIELGEQLATHHPHLKVIYSSATPKKMLKLNEDCVFLVKPFTEEMLLSAVNSALQGTSKI